VSRVSIDDVIAAIETARDQVMADEVKSLACSFKELRPLRAER
jgi:hypothetical protein